MGYTSMSSRLGLIAIVTSAICLVAIAGCASSQPASPEAPSQATRQLLALESPAFAQGADIPKRYTCDGENISPPLHWRSTPPQTQSFALIMDDPDAPGGTFTHWVLFNIPASQTGLPEAQKPGTLGTSGTNSFGRLGYGGPCPPPGNAHRYFFTLYALDLTSLNLSEGAKRSDVEQAMQGHVLGQGQWMGKYQR